jgi:hypothetical protein
MMPSMVRPLPPEELWDVDSFIEAGCQRDNFIADPALAKWIMDTFIVGSGPLVHEAHAHLEKAHIGCLWTDVMNSRHMNEIVAEAECPRPQGSKWPKSRALMQLRNWFGEVPDFILTFYAPWATVADDAGWCAVVEHELCHCGHRRDAMGLPMYDEDGKPIYGLRGHDVEEFVHVVQRYGVENGAGATLQLVEAALNDPTVAHAAIQGCCGTKNCDLRLVA